MIIIPVRLLIICIALGTVFGLFNKGCSEYDISLKSGDMPAEIRLSSLEKGEETDNIYLKFDEHWRIFPASIYEYETYGGREKKPADYSKVNYVYYPIISGEHTYLYSFTELSQKYGEIHKIPKNEMPRIKDFRILVKTDRFEFIGEIPSEWRHSASVEGIVIGTAQSELSNPEKQLVYEMFPSANLYKMLVLDENRKPISKIYSILMIFGGLFLGSYMLFMLFKFVKKKLSE